MSSVVIEMATPMPGSPSGAPVPVIQSLGTQTETIASSGTSQATTIKLRRTGDIAVVTNNGTDVVWVNLGAAPTANSNAKHLVLGNTTREFSGQAGDKVAIKNA